MKKEIIVITIMMLIVCFGCGKAVTAPVPVESESVTTDHSDSAALSGERKGQTGTEAADTAEGGQDSSVNKTKTPTAASQETVEAAKKYRGLQFTVSCKSADEVHITVKNTASEGYTLGWVNGPVITCRTAGAEAYWTAEPTRILPGNTVDFVCYFKDISGIPESISISNVCMLNDRGLPVSVNSAGETVEISFTDDDGPDGESSGQQEENIRKLHGETDYDGLSIKADGDRTCIKLTFINDTPDSYALGWANGPTVTCVTTEGEYYTSAESVRLLAGQTYEANYYFDDAAGDLISVRISNINSLDNRGLPVDFSGGGTAEIVFTT